SRGSSHGLPARSRSPRIAGVPPGKGCRRRRTSRRGTGFVRIRPCRKGNRSPRPSVRAEWHGRGCRLHPAVPPTPAAALPTHHTASCGAAVRLDPVGASCPPAPRLGPREGDAMRVLVTGGTGFTGSALVARLVEEGHSVIALD